MPRVGIYVAMAFLATSFAGPSAAHEFWLEPRDFTPEPGSVLEADIKVGQNFKGNSYSFNPSKFTRFDVIEGERAELVDSRIGDLPAVARLVEAPGPVTLLHQTTDSILTYTERETFERFVEEEGLDGTLETHASRGLPETGFREVYSRHVKALAGVGGEGGADRAHGLPVELVVEGDPYADPLPEAVTVRALADGEPMVDALVNVFVREGADGEASERLRPRTDAEGRVTIPLAPGRRYLANVVLMREPSPEKAEETGAVWESQWASVTFATEE